MPMHIRMVDLQGQYLAIKEEIDAAIQEVLDASAFIKGPAVARFEQSLSTYLDGVHTVGVANGTDALQIAFMALGVQPGDEIITTPFTFVATAEAAALLGAVPVFADIDPKTFNINPSQIEALITPRTRAIVPVHLFGQPADMDSILAIAARHGIKVIEDNAQAVGARYQGRRVGSMGHMSTLSFFPSKNLGCYGDGGAVMTNDDHLHETIRKIANHGSTKKYFNEIVGVNSRLDGLQAAILDVKLRHLDAYMAARQEAADRYDALLAGIDEVETPFRAAGRDHVFHQYTIRVRESSAISRDALSQHLKDQQIPHAIYYPVPLHQLPVFKNGHAEARWNDLPETEKASREVLSLPMHTELTRDQQEHIVATLKAGLKQTTTPSDAVFSSP